MNRLKAGVAVKEITPEVGGLLAEDLGTRPSTGIAGPLMAKAVVLDNGDTQAAIVTLDLIGLRRADAATLADAISARTGIERDAVMVISSRTRAGPLTAAAPGVAEVDRAAIARVLSQTPEAVAQAQANLQDASLGIGHAILPHLVYNHRLMTRNMKAISAWLDTPRDEVLYPEGPTDPQFEVVVVRDGRGRPMALLWSFAAENRFLSDGLISPALPGLVQGQVAERIGRDVPCLYLGGCGSNVSYAHPLEPSADAAASAIMAVQLETPADPMIRLGSASEQIVLPIRDASQFWSKADIELKAPQAAATFAHEVELLQAEGAHALSATLQVLRLGRHALVCLPGTPFVEFGLAIRQASPFQQTLVVGSNDDAGTIITRQAFARGGFETWTSRAARVGPGGGEYLVDVAADLLKQLWRA
jgi:hypothetical protein